MSSENPVGNGIPTIQEPVQSPIKSSQTPKVNGVAHNAEPREASIIEIPKINGISLPSVVEPDLFDDTNLISPTVASSLPPTYTLRALRRSDYHSGFLDVLRVLTTVGEITEEQWNRRYDWMGSQGKGGYYLLVIEDTSRAEKEKVVATGALLVERKFIHNLGQVGHIEDIAVAKDQQGKKLGLKMIQALDFIAEQVGCYKSILDCSEANEGFYVKCGFKRAGLEMAHYYDGSTSKDMPTKLQSKV